MNEIERASIEKAIKGFEHEIRCIKASESRSWNTETRQRKVERETIAVELLRAELTRQENAPLTCEGCKQQGEWDNELEYGYNCPCIQCERNYIDRYEPKGEPNV